MKKLLFIFIIASIYSCKTTTVFYVVRHAEKETTNTMTTDVPLSEAGQQRAIALRNLLASKKIHSVYSTNFVRTKATAQPLADSLHLTIQVYSPKDASFVNHIRNTKNGNVLIVGHSNTVDDIVNELMKESQLKDLPETEYGDLFVVTKKGSHYSLEKKKF